MAASKAPKSPRPGRLEHKVAQLRTELEVHKDALAAAQMEVALLTERLAQSQDRSQVCIAFYIARTAFCCRCPQVQMTSCSAWGWVSHDRVWASHCADHRVAHHLIYSAAVGIIGCENTV